MNTQSVYTAAVSRSLDLAAAHSLGISSFALMERAGIAAFAVLMQHFGDTSSIWVLCGKGNNGGDGYLLATQALSRGLNVQVFEFAGSEDIHGDACAARTTALEQGIVCSPASQLTAFDDDVVVVDALYGSGFRGALDGDALRVLQVLKTSAAKILAVDLPTGVNSDTGFACEYAVVADVTVTFIGVKRGCVTGAGKAHCGELVFRDLGVPGGIYADRASATWFCFEHKMLPKRPIDGHKGNFGHLVIVGGDTHMGGAVILAACAALRVGCGLITVITRDVHRSGMQAHRPEVMVCSAEDEAEMTAVLNKADGLLIGPGLGTASWGERLLAMCLRHPIPKVLDADALNLLPTATSFEAADLHNCVLTPHPGEAARLLAIGSDEVQVDRFAAAQQIFAKFGAVAVLKGPGTLVVGQNMGICQHGNAGMASAGMGDVLAGTIASLIVQGVAPEAAAQLGVALHSAAADVAAAQLGPRSLLASDVVTAMMHLLADT